MKKSLIVLMFFVATSALGSIRASNDDYSRLTYDIGFSSGETNHIKYSEYNLGLNWWLGPSFVWRNAGFGRSQEGTKTIYGLDTSFRLSPTFDLGDTSSLNFFIGPGYRFVSEGKNAPIAESGLVLHLAGLSIGGGAKVIFNKAIDKTLENDVQYFILLGGGGTL